MSEQLAANVAALRLLKDVSSGRTSPALSREQLETLCGYRGWEGIRSEAYDWRGLPKGELRELLTDDEMRASVAARDEFPALLDASVVERVWDLVRDLAAALSPEQCAVLRVCDPCAGVGQVVETDAVSAARWRCSAQAFSAA